jgi:S1-C subfamily serine protease
MKVFGHNTSIRRVVLVLLCCAVSPALNAKASDTVTIASDPPGARVEVNGKVIGTTPLNWKVGNWALNPSKSWALSKHLDTPLTMTLIKEGFVPRTISLTGAALRWVSLNGASSYVYYVIGSTTYNVKLQKVGDFLGGSPFNTLGPTDPGGSGNEGSFEAMINRALPAVVTITSSSGSGSGFFVSNSGVIVTNKHVVGHADHVRVLNAFGKMFESESVYCDADHDLAVVKVACTDCAVMTLAEPATINVGQDVIAIGSPGLAGMTFKNTVTRGIVSAFRGPGDNGHVYVQTDAQINPGNSGGPLLNRWGHVVGVNTLKVVSEGYSGLNFAISSNDVLAMLERRFQYRAIRGTPPATSGAKQEKGPESPSDHPAERALTNQDVVKLREAGLSEELVIAKIKSSPASYQLDTDALIGLKNAGVPEAILAAMLEAQRSRRK